MNAELTHADGIAQQTNYHAFEAMRLYQVPLIEVRALTNTNEVRGIGEPTVSHRPPRHWPMPFLPQPASASASSR